MWFLFPSQYLWIWKFNYANTFSTVKNSLLCAMYILWRQNCALNRFKLSHNSKHFEERQHGLLRAMIRESCEHLATTKRWNCKFSAQTEKKITSLVLVLITKLHPRSTCSTNCPHSHLAVGEKTPKSELFEITSLLSLELIKPRKRKQPKQSLGAVSDSQALWLVGRGPTEQKEFVIDLDCLGFKGGSKILVDVSKLKLKKVYLRLTTGAPSEGSSSDCQNITFKEKNVWITYWICIPPH